VRAIPTPRRAAETCLLSWPRIVDDTRCVGTGAVGRGSRPRSTVFALGDDVVLLGGALALVTRGFDATSGRGLVHCDCSVTGSNGHQQVVFVHKVYASATWVPKARAW
jgi:hypothetical protein